MISGFGVVVFELVVAVAVAVAVVVVAKTRDPPAIENKFFPRNRNKDTRNKDTFSLTICSEYQPICAYLLYRTECIHVTFTPKARHN